MIKQIVRKILWVVCAMVPHHNGALPNNSILPTDHRTVGYSMLSISSVYKVRIVVLYLKK